MSDRRCPFYNKASALGVRCTLPVGHGGQHVNAETCWGGSPMTEREPATPRTEAGREMVGVLGDTPERKEWATYRVLRIEAEAAALSERAADGWANDPDTTPEEFAAMVAELDRDGLVMLLRHQRATLRNCMTPLSERAAGAGEALDVATLAGRGESWPLIDVLRALRDATTHLLRDHSCDTAGYEGYGHARDAVARYVALLAAQPVSHASTEAGDAGPSDREILSRDGPEYMCPNCVTPWKCNGPHIPQAAQR